MAKFIYKVINIKLEVGHSQQQLVKTVAKKMKTTAKTIVDVSIIKKSLDARDRKVLFFVYQVLVTCNCQINIKAYKDVTVYQIPTKEQAESIRTVNIQLQRKQGPVIVGTGPAGLMAALLLAEQGLAPIIIERGYEVERRAKDINDFWASGQLNTESNVQFGEGGAGTFSDGKLTTRISDSKVQEVYERLVAAGAPAEIMYQHKPHIGTDKLRVVIRNIRNKLIELGAEIRFGHKLVGLELVADSAVASAGSAHDDQMIKKVKGVIVEHQKQKYTIKTEQVILAIGHSARDTYQILWECGVEIISKPLAIGVRIEHPQQIIDNAQYGEFFREKYDANLLGAAEYQLVNKKSSKEQRTVYSFCMCPGGEVVAAASERGGVVTNGMSYQARNLANANSALVVNVEPSDYGYLPGNNPLLGVEYLRKWEQRAYQLGGANYYAPVQLLGDFMAGKASKQADLCKGRVQASYRPGVTATDLSLCLPEYVVNSLRQTVPEFARKIRGYAMEDALLTAVETRTSSPIRIVRAADGQSVNVRGLYPTGEGAGYAGGIISAAVDGLRAAERTI